MGNLQVIVGGPAGPVVEEDDLQAVLAGCTWITGAVTPMVIVQSGGNMTRTGLGLYRFTLDTPIVIDSFPLPFFPIIGNVSNGGSAFCSLSTMLTPPITVNFLDFATLNAALAAADLGAFTFLLIRKGS